MRTIMTLAMLWWSAAGVAVAGHCYPVYHAPYVAPTYVKQVELVQPIIQISPIVVPLYAVSYLPVVAPTVTATTAVSVEASAITVRPQVNAQVVVPAVGVAAAGSVAVQGGGGIPADVIAEFRAELRSLRTEVQAMRAAAPLKAEPRQEQQELPAFAIALRDNCLACHAHGNATKGGGFRLTDDKSQLADLGPAGWRKVAASVRSGDMPKGHAMPAKAKQDLLAHADAQAGVK